MNAAQTAAADQAEAREREFDRKAQRVAFYFLAAAALLGIYSVLVALGHMPAAPWSPLGQ